MSYWQGFPQTTYVDHIGYKVKYSKGELELGYFSKQELYHYFNGYMLLAVL